MIDSKQIAKTKLFAFHSCLYANDVAYNAIKSLKRYVTNKDKETKKIYRALENRIEAYNACIMKLVEGFEYFYADYNSQMDDINDENVYQLTTEIENIYKKAGIEDYEFLAQTETARSMVMLSIHVVDRMNKKLMQYGIEIPTLKYYSIQEIGRVMENFSKWVNRKNPECVKVGEDKVVINIFAKIGEALVSHKNFETAWYYADGQDRNKKMLNDTSRTN